MLEEKNKSLMWNTLITERIFNTTWLNITILTMFMFLLVYNSDHEEPISFVIIGICLIGIFCFIISQIMSVVLTNIKINSSDREFTQKEISTINFLNIGVMYMNILVISSLLVSTIFYFILIFVLGE